MSDAKIRFMKYSLLFFCFILSVFGSSQELQDSLLLHYKFDSNYLDSGIYGYDGENHNTTFTADRFGHQDSAVYFNGIDSFIQFPNVNTLKPELPVSFSFWVYYDVFDGNHTYLLSTSFEEDRSAGVYFNTQMSTGRYGINYGDGTYHFSPGTRRSLQSNMIMTEQEWHHIAVVVNGPEDMKIYVDCRDFGGEYEGSGGPLVYSDLPGVLGVGRRNIHEDNKYFKGALDDFYYWNRAITQEEVADLCIEGYLKTEDYKEFEFTISPNPVKDVLHIYSDETIGAIEILNSSGKLISNQKLNSNTVDVAYLPSGVYFLRIKTQKGIQTKKFIKN